MTTASIDIDTLDKLFDNQQKLDDIFNSVFDDDHFINSATPFSDYAQESINREDIICTADLTYEDNMSLYSKETSFSQGIRGFAYLSLTVIEIAAIYYGIANFT